jgi:hypothetical protein
MAGGSGFDARPRELLGVPQDGDTSCMLTLWRAGSRAVLFRGIGGPMNLDIDLDLYGWNSPGLLSDRHRR